MSQIWLANCFLKGIKPLSVTPRKCNLFFLHSQLVRFANQHCCSVFGKYWEYEWILIAFWSDEIAPGNPAAKGGFATADPLKWGFSQSAQKVEREVIRARIFCPSQSEAFFKVLDSYIDSCLLIVSS